MGATDTPGHLPPILHDWNCLHAEEHVPTFFSSSPQQQQSWFLLYVFDYFNYLI